MGASPPCANSIRARNEALVFNSHMLLFLAGILLGAALMLLPWPQLSAKAASSPTQLTLNFMTEGPPRFVTATTVSCVQQPTNSPHEPATSSFPNSTATVADAGAAIAGGRMPQRPAGSDKWCTAAPPNATDNLERLLADAARFAPPLMPTAVAIVDVNMGFLPMAERLWQRCQDLKPPLRNLIFVALDSAARDYMAANFSGALVHFNEDETFEASARAFREKEYNTIVMHKWVLAWRIMCAGFDPLIMDVDVVFVRNPFNFLADLPACDLTATTESMPPNILQDNERRWDWKTRSQEYYQAFINTGFMLWRSSEASLSTVDALLKARDLPANRDDQAKFNTLIQRRLTNNTDTKLNLPFSKLHSECATWGGLSLHVLSPVLFGSQKHFYEHKLPQMAAVAPYIIHYNWISGYDEKKKRMVQDGVW